MKKKWDSDYECSMVLSYKNNAEKGDEMDCCDDCDNCPYNFRLDICSPEYSSIFLDYY